MERVDSNSLEIREAEGKGRGVFAKRPVESGMLVWDYSGEERWIHDIPQELWQYCFQVDYDRYVVPERGSPGWFMNHSCEPNCVISGRTAIVALRRISPGEEITFDYSTNVGWEEFAMECSCGATHCRNVIRSYQRLSREDKRRFGTNVSSFLLAPRRQRGDAGKSP